MSLRFACPCGKNVQAPDSMAGKKAKCPACGSVVQVPSLEPKLDDLFDAHLLQEDELAAAANSGLSSLSLGPSPAQQRAQQLLIKRLLIGGGILAGLLVLISAIVALIGLATSSGPRRSAQTNPESVQQDPSTGPMQGPIGSVTPEEPKREDLVAGRLRSERAEPSAASIGENTRIEPVPRSMPNATTAAPAWLVESNDSLVDLGEYFAVPSAAENAAPLYLDALWEFGSILTSELFPGDRQRESLVSKRSSRMLDLSLRFSQSKAVPPEAARPTPAEIDAVLGEYTDAIEKLLLAQRRPECVFEYDLGIGALSHVHSAHGAGSVLRLRASRALEHGNFDAALAAVESMLRLSRDLRPRGGSSMQINSIALQRLVCTSPGEPGVISDMLSRGDITPAQCDQLLAVLDAHDNASVDAIAELNKTQYVMARMALHDIEHGTGSFDPAVLRERRFAGPPWRILLEETLYEFGRRAFSSYSVFSDENKRLPRIERVHKYLEYRSAVESMGRAEFAAEVQALNRCYQGVLATNDKNLLNRQRQVEQSADELKDTLLAFCLEPSLPEQIVQAEAHFQATRCLVALKKWELEKGRDPADLAEVVQAAGMEAIPLDPFSGQPLRMASLDGATVIYSVGPDGKDDGARSEYRFRESETGDLVYRL